MATIKSYTDLEQSKVLAKILPLESADMMYHSVETEYGSGAFVATSKVITNGLKNDDFYVDDIPCWSLASLLEIIPYGQVSRMIHNNKWEASSWNETILDPILAIEEFDNPLDACYELIVKLHELNLL